MPKAVLTYEDLQNFPDDNVRREIIDGELYVTPSPVPLHQRVVLRIAIALQGYAEHAGGEAFVSPIDVVLSAQNVVVPDVVYISSDRMHTLSAKAIYGVPSLFVEVLSPSTKDLDLGEKRVKYARFGLPEYWIVNTEAQIIERCSDPGPEGYVTVRIFDTDMPAATLSGFVLPFEVIFA